jgi:hypothetical protein
LFAQNTFSQDWILTTNGDTINCSIRKVTDAEIKYSFTHKSVYRNATIPLFLVEEHFKAESSKGEQFTKEGYFSIPRFRLSFSGGLSYLTSEMSDDIPDDFEGYYNELKSGKHITADFNYYFTEKFGAGLRYSRFRTSNSMDNIYITDHLGVTRTGKLSDDITTSFYGAMFSVRFRNRNNNGALMLGASSGFIDYRNYAVMVDDLKISGSTFGHVFDAGYEIATGRNLLIGIQVSLTLGYLTTITVENGVEKEIIQLENDNFEGMNRVDFALGIRFQI